MKEKFIRFMAGRYGADQLSRFLSFAALALIVLNLFFRSSVLWILGIAALVCVYLRMFSRNFEKRRKENEAYLRMKNKLTGGIVGIRRCIAFRVGCGRLVTVGIVSVRRCIP